MSLLFCRKFFTMLPILLIALCFCPRAYTSDDLRDRDHPQPPRRQVSAFDENLDKFVKYLYGVVIVSKSLVSAPAEQFLFNKYGLPHLLNDPRMRRLSGVPLFLINQPIVASRCGSIYSETKGLLASNLPEYVLLKYFHAMLNHAFPVIWMSFQNETSLPNSLKGSLPLLVASNLNKGIQDNDCPLKRIAQRRAVLPNSRHELGAYAFMGVAAISKGWLVQEMYHKLFGSPFIDDQSRFIVSCAVGGTSTLCTLAFEGDQFLNFYKYYQHNVINNPNHLIVSTLKSMVIMSYYYGVSSELLPNSLLMGISIYCLESITETLTTDYQVGNYIIPCLKKVSNWFYNRRPY